MQEKLRGRQCEDGGYSYFPVVTEYFTGLDANLWELSLKARIGFSRRGQRSSVTNLIDHPQVSSAVVTTTSIPPPPSAA